MESRVRLERLRQGLADMVCLEQWEGLIPSQPKLYPLLYPCKRWEVYSPQKLCQKGPARDPRHRWGKERGTAHMPERVLFTHPDRNAHWPIKADWRTTLEKMKTTDIIAALTDTLPYWLIFKPLRNQQTLEETSNSKERLKLTKRHHHPYIHSK